VSDRKATSAGMYDYALGGIANTAADRRAVDAARRILPELSDGIWANRGFVQRAVTRMAGEWGIRQFLDLGAGLPTQRSTHDVVAEVIPDGRVVYVDNDPGVVERGRQILAGLDNAVAIEADIRDPDTVLAHPEARRLIDLTQPVGIVGAAVLHFIPDSDDPWRMMARYVAAVPSGSYVALCALTSDRQADRIIDRVRRTLMSVRFHLRTKAQMERFFDGLDIVPPHAGALPIVTHAGLWGAEDPETANDDGSRWFYAAVGRKP
jgi:hypothetical protein